MNFTLEPLQKYEDTLVCHSCHDSIDYNSFINHYNIENIDSLKILRKEKKSYLNFMFLLNTTFICFYLVEFSWSILFLHSILYLVSFLFFNQYDYFIKFSANSQINEFKILSKDYDLFSQLENHFYSKKIIPTLFKNESPFKSYIRSKQSSS